MEDEKQIVNNYNNNQKLQKFSGKPSEFQYFQDNIAADLLVKFPESFDLVFALLEEAKEGKESAIKYTEVRKSKKKLKVTHYLYFYIMRTSTKKVYNTLQATGRVQQGNGLLLYSKLHKAYGQAHGNVYNSQLQLIQLKQGANETISNLLCRFHQYNEGIRQPMDATTCIAILLNSLNSSYTNFVIQANLNLDSLDTEINNSHVEKLSQRLLAHEFQLEKTQKNAKYNNRSGKPYNNKKKEVCRHFRDFGNCRYGVKCKYVHRSPLSTNKPGVRIDDKKKNTPGTCFSYANKGFCPTGSECKWADTHVNPKVETNLFCTFSVENITEAQAILDSGANAHTLRYKPKNAYNLKACNELCKTADGTLHKATHTMDVGPLRQVFLVPSLQSNIISISRFQADNPHALIMVETEGMNIKMDHNNNIFGKLVNGLYVIDIDKLIQIHQSVLYNVNWEPQGPEEATRHFHESIGHSSIQRIQANKQYYTKELPATTSYFYCNSCKLSKHKHRTNHECSQNKPDKYLEALSADFSGTNGKESAHRDREWLLVTDQSSGFKWVFTAHTQPQGIMKMHATMNEEMNRLGRKIQRLRVDNASTLNDGVNKEWCMQHGIAIKPTIAGNHNQNGIAERAIQSIQTVARTCLLSSKAPSHYWHHALHYATWTLNRLPNARNKDNAPSVIAAGLTTHIDATQFHPFFAKVSVRKVNNELARGDKFTARGNEGKFLYNLKLGCMVDVDGTAKKRDQVIFLQQEEGNIPLISNDDDNDEEDDDQDDYVPEGRTKYTRNPRPVLTYDQLQRQKEYFDEHIMNEVTVQPTLKQRQAAAVKVELLNHRKNNSFTIVDDPGPHIKKIRAMFIFRDKYNGSEFVKTKGRMVLCGNQQTRKTNVFAPVVDPMIIKLLCIMALDSDYQMSLADVVAAFLYSLIDEKYIYFYPPPQMNLPRGKVCRVNKGIYGLIQAPKLWYKHLSSTLLKMNLTRSSQDSCLFYNEDKSIYIAFHVDDLLILSKDDKTLEDIRKQLQEVYKIKFTEIDYFLSLKIQRNKTTLLISDIQRIIDMKNKHCPEDTRIEIIPIKPSIKDEEKADLEQVTRPMVSEKSYRSLLGELNYVSTKTRPDISQAVSYLQRFQHIPTKSRYKEALRIVRYLYHTKQMVLRYTKGNDNTMEISTDSDWAGDLIKSRSTSGVIIRWRSNLIYWKSKKQSTVASSTCAAELIAAKKGIDESVYILKLLKELDLVPNKITLNIDNQAARKVLIAQHNTSIKKYLKIKIDALQEKVTTGYLIHGINIGKLNIKYVPTQHNEADLQTKILDKNTFIRHRDKYLVQK